VAASRCCGRTEPHFPARRSPVTLSPGHGLRPWTATTTSGYPTSPLRTARLCSYAASAPRTVRPGMKTGDQISPPGGFVGGGLQISSRKLERATYDSVAFRFIAANDHLGPRAPRIGLDRSCPPSKARTIDRPNEFQIRGWPDWLHFDAEVEQLEGAVLDGGELRIEDEARLRGAVHGHDIAGHGGEVSEETTALVFRCMVASKEVNPVNTL
jgi:hypothetical protein